MENEKQDQLFILGKQAAELQALRGEVSMFHSELRALGSKLDAEIKTMCAKIDTLMALRYRVVGGWQALTIVAAVLMAGASLAVAVIK